VQKMAATIRVGGSQYLDSWTLRNAVNDDANLILVAWAIPLLVLARAMAIPWAKRLHIQWL
jgi:hypothetical protein